MKNEELISLIDELNAKAKILVEKNQRLRLENSELKEEVKEVQSLVERKNQEIKSFQNQFKISKIVSSFTEGKSDSREVKLLINEYVKEIDKCIAFLNEL